jgi:hypothetical protein
MIVSTQRHHNLSERYFFSWPVVEKLDLLRNNEILFRRGNSFLSSTLWRLGPGGSASGGNRFKLKLQCFLRFCFLQVD